MVYVRDLKFIKRCYLGNVPVRPLCLIKYLFMNINTRCVDFLLLGSRAKQYIKLQLYLQIVYKGIFK